MATVFTSPPDHADNPTPPAGGGTPDPTGGTPDLTRPTPTNVTVTNDGDLADAAPAGAQLLTRTFDDAYTELKNNTDLFFKVPGNGYRGPHLLQTWGEYFLYKAGLIRDLPGISRPKNADTMPDAGHAVVKAVTTLPEAGAMKVDPTELNRNLLVIAYWAQWQEAVDWMSPMIKLNRAHLEQKVATTVTKGVARIEGGLPENSMLRGVLGKALKWLGVDAEKAQATRRDHEKQAQKNQGDGSATPPPTGAGTGTVGIPKTQPGSDNGNPGTGNQGPASGTPAQPPLAKPAPAHRAPKKKTKKLT